MGHVIAPAIVFVTRLNMVGAQDHLTDFWVSYSVAIAGSQL